MMRWALGIVSLLIAMAVVLMLTADHGRRSVEAVGDSARFLREDIPPRPFDRARAVRLLESLEGWAGAPAPPEGELLEAGRTAAAWAAGSDPGSHHHRAAVKLRGAAVALLGPGGDGRSPRREEARRHLAEARRSLHDPGAPQGAVEGLRTQVEDVQLRQQERHQEAERSLR